MSRLDRFLRLEKRRPPGPAARALGSPARFGAEPPAEERPLRVLEDDAMPFVRCCVCRADSHVAARTCPNCGSDLATPVQRAFNQALARDYQQRREEEEEVADEVRAARTQADREAREASQQALEALLRMERGQPAGPGTSDRDPPLGLRLARRIRDPRLRLAALASAGLAPLALILGGAPQVGLPLLLVVAAAFAPRRLRRMIWED